LENTTAQDQAIIDEQDQVAKQIADNEKLISRFERIANDPTDAPQNVV
jgi:hypothetical protein